MMSELLVVFQPTSFQSNPYLSILPSSLPAVAVLQSYYSRQTQFFP